MEFRCTNCQHVGAASEIRPSAKGVVLVCANCAHENILEVAGSPTPAHAPSEVRPAAVPDEAPEEATPNPLLEPAALARLIPQPGPGPRCRKCAQRLDPGDEYCSRCGLSVTESRRFPEGEEPWERPAPGKEAAYEQANLLWKSVEENPTPENLDKFVDFVRAEELLELGVRRLRFHLVEHPEDAHALAHLETIASSFQARIIVAQAEAKVRAASFTEATSRAKVVLLWTNLIFWGGVLLFFAVYLWQKLA